MEAKVVVNLKTFLGVAASLLRHTFAALASSAIFSLLWGTVISFNRGAPDGALIDAFLLFVLVVPVVFVLGLPLTLVFQRAGTLGRSFVGPMAAFSLVLTMSFLIVAILSRTTNADTGHFRYVFWAYEIGATPQLIWVTSVVALAGAVCGGVYWRIKGRPPKQGRVGQ